MKFPVSFLILKPTTALRIQAQQFAVDYRILYFQRGEIFSKFIEGLVRVSLPSYEFAVAVPDVRQCAEAVVLQFEQKIIVVEWSSHEARLGGVEPGWAQMNVMRTRRRPDERS